MYVSMTCVIVDPDAANRKELAGFLARFGVQTVAELAGPESLPQLLSRPDAPQLVILNLDPAAHDTLARVSHLPRQHAAISFFAMSQTLDPHLLIEAMHLGISEFIPLPMSEQKLSAAVERVAHTHGLGKKARIINVIPTMGGCGSTTIACNVAASLAKAGKSVLID